MTTELPPKPPRKTLAGLLSVSQINCDGVLRVRFEVTA